MIRTSSKESLANRLREIFEGVQALIERHEPFVVSVEDVFHGKNAQSALKLGHARGAILVAAALRRIPIAEYAPRQIKKAVVGTGNASKEQVASMLKSLLNFSEAPKLLDATDALAVAVCHHFQNGKTAVKSKSWKAFLTENPGRVK